MTSRLTLDNRLAERDVAAALRAKVRSGLTADPKWVPSAWFYDHRGNELFERITQLPEYYPTRAERQLLRGHADAIAALTRARTLVELGSGSSDKTRLLLDALLRGRTLERYEPMDVSAAALTAAGEALTRDYPRLRVAAATTDLEADLTLPADGEGQGRPRLVAFLGSTLGNLDTPGRAALYARLRTALSPGDWLLLGIDLVKDPAVLVRAYADAEGVTEEFNRNILHVLNRELGADFVPGAFDHRAVWREREERVEMRLRARHAQTVKLPSLDLTVDFGRGEELRTEISVKFRRGRLTGELAQAGFTVRRWWTSRTPGFALLLATIS